MKRRLARFREKPPALGLRLAGGPALPTPRPSNVQNYMIAFDADGSSLVTFRVHLQSGGRRKFWYCHVRAGEHETRLDCVGAYRGTPIVVSSSGVDEIRFAPMDDEGRARVRKNLRSQERLRHGSRASEEQP